MSEENIKNKISKYQQFSQMLLESLLLGDEHPDFTGMERKTNPAASATWSRNTTAS